MRSLLHDGWTVRAVAGDVPSEVRGITPASVPGCVHTDLLAAGLIPDPYRDDQERLQPWVALADWRYETTFLWHDDGADRAELVFDGLDTIATVELNGQVLAQTKNMHRTYRIDVTGHLRAEANVLAVTFASPVRHADRASLQLGARPHVNHHPYNAIRKMACSFGWDWGPDLATAGIWRPVALETWSTARLAGVRPLATVEGARGLLAVHIDLDHADRADRAEPAAQLTVTATVAGVTGHYAVPAGAATAVVELSVEGVERWWPRGHGSQRMYDVDVDLRDESGAVVDTWAGRVGFRSVRLDTAADEHGTSFVLVINDRPLFIKGANWIPDDAFPHRVTRQRYATRVAQAQQAGVNLLRVWGGGIFESDDFYDVCDELGVLTWQDFLFACAAYAEEEPMRSEVEAEVRDNVTRLTPHPSLVLWNGGNENLWGHADWGWQARLDGKSWGLGYYLDLLPRIVAELDPHRPYSPGSPWSPSAERHPNDPNHGTMHIWDVWNDRDYTAYRDYVPRFCSEFGWQGPPTMATLRSAITDDPLTPESPGMLVHQKAIAGNDKLTSGLVAHLPVPDVFEDWHWAMSLNQARAVRVGIEHLRSWSPRCAGSIVWQLNDCWPVTSWAAIDGYGRLKPMWYALRHAHADRLVTIQPREPGLAAVLVNDTDEPWQATLTTKRVAYHGEALDAYDEDVTVPARGTSTVTLPPALVTCDDDQNELLVAQASGRRGLWFFAEDRDSQLGAPVLDCDARRTTDGYRVEVGAQVLVRDLSLLVDQVDPDAVVDDMLLTLLPGEHAVFHVRTTAEVPPQQWLQPHVLRSANQLLVPAPR